MAEYRKSNFKKSFGAGPRKGPARFARRESGPVTMHTAECNKCHTPCEVPFRPNGKKPVYCSNCYKRDENRSFERRDYGAPQEDYRPRSAAPRSSDTRGLERQVAMLETKLDRVLELLEGKRAKKGNGRDA